MAFPQYLKTKCYVTNQFIKHAKLYKKTDKMNKQTNHCFDQDIL